MLVLPPLIVRHRVLGFFAVVALMTKAYSAQPKTPAVRPTWAAMNTTFGGYSGSPDPVREFQTAGAIRELALSSTARVLVFPESAVRGWNDAAELFWEPLLRTLAARRQTVVLGTSIGIPGTVQRLNGVLVRGTDTPAFFVQHIPVPFSMWRPFSDSGFPLRLDGPATIRIAGERVGILICYEMLLTWPVLTMSLDHPTVLVGVANDYWARGTPIPAVQRMCISAWARLFSIPSLVASNT
jgi:hypothetical protein